jgi:hypothetical protein
MALDVINDSRSEPHRNWVCSAVVQVLGVRIDTGLWVLRLHALESGGVSITLTGPSGARFKAQVPKPGRDRVRDLDTALKGAVSRLS